MSIPKALQSIRFRLSLAFSIVVFSVGSFLIAGIYFYQVNSLAEPVLQSQPVVMADPETGELVETSIKVVFPEAAQQFAVEQDRTASLTGVPSVSCGPPPWPPWGCCSWFPSVLAGFLPAGC